MPLTNTDHFILNFTPTGMIPTKSMTPHVPVTPDEIVEQTLGAAKQGATMAHLHARDDETGLPTYKKDVYAKIIEGIRNRNQDLILCVSTSGRNFNEFEKRSESLNLTGDLKPDFGSLTLSSLNFNKQASVNSPEMIQRLAGKMLDMGIKPELEVFDLGMINYAHYLIHKGLIEPPYYFNLILGNIACAQANLLSLGLMIKELPPNSYWSVGAVGQPQLKMNLISIASGGGIRIGLEDNIWFDEQRTHLATNAELLERIITMAESMGKHPLDPIRGKQLLGVQS